MESAPEDWPEKGELFKAWMHLEKEAVLRAMSVQPQVFRNLTARLIRGLRSVRSKNSGTTVKKLNMIALYDDFFTSSDQERVLSHELSHLYLHNLDQEKLSDLVEELGWRQNTISRALVRLEKSPKLKQDSDQSITEDIANHLENFLHDEDGLRKKFPKRYELIKRLVPSDFKLEKP